MADNQKGPFDNHFLHFCHVGSFPVENMCSLNRRGRLMGCRDEMCFRISDNNVTYEFGCRIMMKSHTRNGINYRKLCPYLSLHNFGSSHRQSVTANYVVSSALQNGEVRMISQGEKVFKKGFRTYLTSMDDDNSLPSTIEELTQMGYLTEGENHLKIKYELKIHRGEFVDKNDEYHLVSFKQLIMAPIPRQPSDLDRIEFEQLKNEVKDENRFVLISADNTTRFCAHKDRLSVASGFFKSSFEHPETTENQHGVMCLPLSGQGLKEMLTFIYLGNVTDELNDFVELANASEFYYLQDLKTICHTKLLDRFVELPAITITQVIAYLCLAHQLNMAELKNQCMVWLSDQWGKVENEKEIKNMRDSREGRHILKELEDYKNEQESSIME